jgi:hypothetical protein
MLAIALFSMILPPGEKRGDEKMGSYDTGESYTPPTWNANTSRETHTPEPRNTTVPRATET